MNNPSNQSSTERLSPQDAFAERLLDNLKKGRKLGDAHSHRVMESWVRIVSPLSAADAMMLIPARLKKMWKEGEHIEAMKRCGLTNDPPTQFEFLGARVASYMKLLSGLRNHEGHNGLTVINQDVPRLEKRNIALNKALQDIGQTAMELEAERSKQSDTINDLENKLNGLLNSLHMRLADASDDLSDKLNSGLNDPLSPALAESRAKFKVLADVLRDAGYGDDLPPEPIEPEPVKTPPNGGDSVPDDTMEEERQMDDDDLLLITDDLSEKTG